MCGIAAIFAYGDSAPSVASDELLRMREAMASRGPDGAGLWVSADGRVGFAHRRLAIIDPSEAGQQPMATRDGALCVTFNGEIYNYRELRRELEGKGYAFQSDSDTEVLLHLYRERGPEMLRDLRGMYAFAIWDQTKAGLFLARDPLGIKPLYYFDDGSTVRVASQVKALLASGTVATDPEPAGHVGFFLWGYVPEPYTLYRGIRALPAGSTLWVQRRKAPCEKRYFSVTALFDGAAKSSASDRTRRTSTDVETVVHLRQRLVESVRYHLVADVPVGLFLSSGRDSSTLAALVAEAGGDLRTVTLGFREYAGTANDETPLAERVARQYGAEHHTVWLTKRDFEQDIPRILGAMDQPSMDGVNTYFVAKAAAGLGLKVAISGLGGDELFAGYSHFRDIPRLVHSIGWGCRLPAIGKAFRVVSAPVLKHFTSPKYAGLLEYGGSIEAAYLLRRGLFMPWELADHMDREMVHEGWQELQPLLQLQRTAGSTRDERLKICALEMEWYLRGQLLRDTDWASMAHSLEVRTPFVDWQLLTSLAPMLGGANALSKRELVRVPEKPLPEQVLERSKTGFSVPVREWMNEAVRGRGSGSRAWAKFVYRNLSNSKRMLMLLTDAYGGQGGIAKFNRDFLDALASHPQYREIVALPRLAPTASVSETLPAKLRYDLPGTTCKAAYAWRLAYRLVRDTRYDVVICGHINLIPLAWLASRLARAPLVLVIHGVDAWQPSMRRLANTFTRKIDYVVSVSETTKERFLAWTRILPEKAFVLPNSIDMTRFQPRPKNPELVSRYRLNGKKVLMTLARLPAVERYKGVDEVLEVLPDLLRQIPELAYLVVGDGEDLPRLREKARLLELDACVVFAGFVSEAEKVDHYNLADAFVMPGRAEGFGIVYLEAMACGVPVVGSVLDGSRETLMHGKLGILVDPRDARSLEHGIRQALARPRGVPADLKHYEYSRFRPRVRRIMDTIALSAISPSA